MKTASVREVQHNLNEVFHWIERGQEVAITRRNRIVAKMIPAEIARAAVKWPDFLGRARKVWIKPGVNRSAES